jgi:hypothetical protein
MGANNTDVNNKNVKIKGFSTVGTAYTRVGSLDYINLCEFENLDLDKPIESSYVQGVGGSAQNIIKNSRIYGTNWTYQTFNNYFELQNVDYKAADFYVESQNARSSKIIGTISVLNGGVGYIDIGAYNGMGEKGFLAGTLKLLSWFNSGQGTLSECSFVASNNNTDFNLSTITETNNGTARAMAITANAANRRFVVTNNLGVNVTIDWVVEFIGRN